MATVRFRGSEAQSGHRSLGTAAGDCRPALLLPALGPCVPLLPAVKRQEVNVCRALWKLLRAVWALCEAAWEDESHPQGWCRSRWCWEGHRARGLPPPSPACIGTVVWAPWGGAGASEAQGGVLCWGGHGGTQRSPASGGVRVRDGSSAPQAW